MSNPNQPSSTNKDAQPTGWESLSEVEFSPVSISTNEISKISLSDSPMGEGREDKRADVADASGMGEVFTDLNGDPSNIQEAVEIAQSLDSQYGMVPGSNGEIAGLNGQVGDFAHTYPGTIDTWPDQARDYITQVTQKWAEAGLIDSTQTGGDPIFTTVEKTVTKLIPNLFYNMLIQAEATAASGVVGSVG